MKNSLKPKTTLSKTAKIALRKRKLANGNYSLFLDKHTSGDGKRDYEFLGLYLTGDKEKDKETLILAEEIRSKRVLEIRSTSYGEFDRKKANGSFIHYFEDLSNGLKKNTKHWRNTLNHLKEYTGGQLTFKQVTPKWLDGFRDYLLEKLKRNSAATYYDTIRAALRLAARDQIILINPVEITDAVTKKQTLRTYLLLDEVLQLDRTVCRNNNVKLAFPYRYLLMLIK